MSICSKVISRQNSLSKIMRITRSLSAKILGLGEFSGLVTLQSFNLQGSIVPQLKQNKNCIFNLYPKVWHRFTKISVKSYIFRISSAQKFYSSSIRGKIACIMESISQQNFNEFKFWATCSFLRKSPLQQRNVYVNKSFQENQTKMLIHESRSPYFFSFL